MEHARERGNASRVSPRKYTVKCDGTGVITRTVTAPNGVIATQTDDLVITGAVTTLDAVFNPILLATSLANASRVSSAIVPGGVLLTRSLLGCRTGHLNNGCQNLRGNAAISARRAWKTGREQEPFFCIEQGCLRYVKSFFRRRLFVQLYKRRTAQPTAL